VFPTCIGIGVATDSSQPQTRPLVSLAHHRLSRQWGSCVACGSAARNTALPSAIKATCWLKGSSLCTLIKKCQLPPGIQSDRRHLMPTHRARCPNTLVNQSRRVSERIACMGSFSLTAKNAKAPCCASICGIKTDAHFANAPVWPSAPVRPSPLFSRETGVGFILFHAKYLLLPQNWPRKQQHTAGASLCALVSWAVASYDTVTGRKLI